LIGSKLARRYVQNRQMKPSLEKATVPRSVVKTAWILAIGLPLYVLSIGPVFKLIDEGYLPEATAYLYLPTSPLRYIPGAPRVYNWYIFHVWNVDNGGDITL